MSRHGMNRHCRLLCPKCGELQQLKSSNDKKITLVCGHARPRILPLTGGRVSVEHLNSEQGKQVFPGSYGDEATRKRTRIKD
jgi:hypothetical protein